MGSRRDEAPVSFFFPIAEADMLIAHCEAWGVRSLIGLQVVEDERGEIMSVPKLLLLHVWPELAVQLLQ
jgi:hypothetical protein